MRRYFSCSSQLAAITGNIPAGARVYAIGDVHGRADLLADLRDQIVKDASSDECPSRKIVVYLGDYVDRGLDSKGVIDLLLQPLDGFESVHLKGNHEDCLLKYLDDYTQGNRWFPIGGDATVVSYGVRIPKGLSPTEREAHLWSEFQQKFPPEHLAFLNSLGHMYRAGNYAFVHAGVLPGTSLEEQDPTDLMWIRKRFLENKSDFGAVVIHGHSTAREPEVRTNRIGIDTGAYATNVLTCLVLEGSTHRFLTTGL
jgi:serine/threonine protein phosphatase 1